MSTRYQTARAVVESQTMGKLEGAHLDTFTASALVGLYEALGNDGKNKFDTIPLDRLVKFAFGVGRP